MTRRSALYRGTLLHARRDEHAHRSFRYPVYTAAIDLAELPALDRELRLFSHGRPNLFSLHDRDYEAGGGGLAAALADLLATNQLPAPHATRLVTNLRVLGYGFNPVSFFLNYDAAGALSSVIAEVNNTYGGRRRYVLGPAQRITRGTRVGFRHVRELFVSPFLHGPASYDFWFDAPLDGDQLAISMHVNRLPPEPAGVSATGADPRHADRPSVGPQIFFARLAGTRQPLTDGALLAAAARYPLMTAQVIGLIHLEAMRLRWRGVPYLRPGPDHRPQPGPPSKRAHDGGGSRASAAPRARRIDKGAVVRPSASLPHPLIPPLPRVVPAVGRALRWLALAQLRAGWRAGRLDLVLPSGKRTRIGPPGTADACAHIQDDRLFLRLLLRGELGAGESFVAGEWSSDDLVGVLRLVLRGTRARGIESPLTRLGQLPSRRRHRRSANTQAGSQRNIHAHYDLGNELYQLFLDPETLSYSCAVFSSPTATAAATRPATLAEAQRAKLDRLCDLLALSPRDHLLEIGCGWGGMAIHAARTRGCRVTAITVSRQQHQLACARVAAAGLGDRVDILYRDYRELEGRYDKLVSIEMLEAVGYEYLPRYFATAARHLRPGGRFALQSITMPDDRFDAYRHQVDWMQTYIFPGSLIPSIAAIAAAAAPAGFRIERQDDIGPDYAATLRSWRERFVAQRSAVTALGFDEPFVRTWLLYLAFSEAAFAERTLGDHQLLLTLAA